MQLFIKRLIFRVLVTAVIITGISTVCWLKIRNNDNHFLRSFSDKLRRLEQTKGEERVVFVGGSNLAFGLDSRRIHDSLEIEVVNAGLHAGVGLKNELDFVYDNLSKATDYIVVCIEYETQLEFTTQFVSEEALMCQSQLPLRQQSLNSILFALVYNNPIQIRVVMNADSSTTAYNRKNFNEFGDVINLPPDNVMLYNDIDKISKEDLRHNFQESIQFIKERLQGFNYIVVPPVTHRLFDAGFLAAYDSTMRAAFKDRFPVPSKAMEFSDSVFYNTIYHLNEAGRQVRTSRMIGAIVSSPLLKGH